MHDVDNETIAHDMYFYFDYHDIMSFENRCINLVITTYINITNFLVRLY